MSAASNPRITRESDSDGRRSVAVFGILIDKSAYAVKLDYEHCEKETPTFCLTKRGKKVGGYASVLSEAVEHFPGDDDSGDRYAREPTRGPLFFEDHGCQRRRSSNAVGPTIQSIAICNACKTKRRVAANAIAYAGRNFGLRNSCCKSSTDAGLTRCTSKPASIDLRRSLSWP